MVSFSDDKSLFSTTLVTFDASATVNLLSLPFTFASYGCHSRSLWGLSIPDPMAWFLMESPTFFLSLLLFPLGRLRTIPSPTSSFLSSPSTTPTAPSSTRFPYSPLFRSSSSMAFAFNFFNAYVSTWSLSHYADEYDDNVNWFRVSVGVRMFLWGMWVNVRSGLELVRIKKKENVVDRSYGSDDLVRGGNVVDRGGSYPYTVVEERAKGEMRRKR